MGGIPMLQPTLFNTPKSTQKDHVWCNHQRMIAIGASNPKLEENAHIPAEKSENLKPNGRIQGLRPSCHSRKSAARHFLLHVCSEVPCLLLVVADASSCLPGGRGLLHKGPKTKKPSEGLDTNFAWAGPTCQGACPLCDATADFFVQHHILESPPNSNASHCKVNPKIRRIALDEGEVLQKYVSQSPTAIPKVERSRWWRKMQKPHSSPHVRLQKRCQHR